MKKIEHEPRECKECGVLITEHDILGLNKKMLGVETGNYYCLDCMAKAFKVDTDYLLDKIEDWKYQGCALF